MLEHRAVDGIVEGLGDLEVVVTLDQFLVDGPALAPEFEVVELFPGDQFDVLVNVVDLLLVEIDALQGRFLHAVPVGVLETRLRRQGNVLEIGKIGFEAVEYGARETLSPFHR